MQSQNPIVQFEFHDHTRNQPLNLFDFLKSKLRETIQSSLFVCGENGHLSQWEIVYKGCEFLDLKMAKTQYQSQRLRDSNILYTLYDKNTNQLIFCERVFEIHQPLSSDDKKCFDEIKVWNLFTNEIKKLELMEDKHLISQCRAKWFFSKHWNKKFVIFEFRGIGIVLYDWENMKIFETLYTSEKYCAFTLNEEKEELIEIVGDTGVINTWCLKEFKLAERKPLEDEKDFLPVEPSFIDDKKQLLYICTRAASLLFDTENSQFCVRYGTYAILRNPIYSPTLKCTIDKPMNEIVAYTFEHKDDDVLMFHTKFRIAVPTKGLIYTMTFLDPSKGTLLLVCDESNWFVVDLIKEKVIWQKKAPQKRLHLSTC